MYLFCTYYVRFRHTINILILYLTENLEIFNVPFLRLFRLSHFSLCLSCTHKNSTNWDHQISYCIDAKFEGETEAL